jgi:hypothetical protein
VIIRLAVPLLGVLLVLIGLALLSGYGENPEEALAAYGPYLPGSPLPSDVTCRTLSDYPGAYGDVCTVSTVPYCQRGYLIVQGGLITYTRWIGCDLPAAYLMAQYGRPERITHFRRVVMLLWEGMSAQVRRTGWFTPMQAVSSVGWW